MQAPPSLTVNTSRAPSRQPSPSRARQKGIVVFSGGSAANSLVDVFNNLSTSNNCPLSYVIPISDNGGSTSELIRVFGGPGIGDLRSRLVRLIPSDDNPNSEANSIKTLFNHRLAKDSKTAKVEWQEILEAEHSVWNGVSTPKKELTRSHLNWVNLEIVKRLRPTSRFDFSGASIGNLFLTGARLFTGSLESAIYLLSVICSVPSSTSVLPAINTNFTHHISVSLANGTTITGQNAISHPSAPTALSHPNPSTATSIITSSTQPHFSPPAPTRTTSSHASSPSVNLKHETYESDKIEDANPPGSLPSLRRPALQVSKSHDESLPARITRLWYINPYGAEISLPVNPRVLDALDSSSCSCIIYAIGSLYTSIIPSLVLRGVGEKIAKGGVRRKILILNGSLDRETGPASSALGASDFVAAIADACAQSRGLRTPVDREEWADYVTHVVYLECVGAPVVDREGLGEVGVETIRCYGLQRGRYDEVALQQVLEMVLGRGDPRVQMRRNTLER